MEELTFPPTEGPRVRPTIGLGSPAGTYTEITQIIAPSEAAAGDLVTVEVTVRNLYSDILAARVGGYIDATEIWFSPDYAWIDPGATFSFTYSFTMPNNAVNIQVWSYYWTGTEWYDDDYGSVYIALAGVPTGTITKKELEYDGNRTPVPAYDIPQGKRGIVHIWGRNDTLVNQKMGISWIVRGPPGYPDGPILQEYSAWEMFWTGPGLEQHFIGPSFALDEVGLYDIRAGLLMNPADPTYVDGYYGDLCTVTAVVPEPTFAGFEILEYITL